MKGELPLIVDVRCRGFPARQVPALPQRVFPLWIRVIFAGLETIGAATIIGIIAWLILRQ